MGGVEALPQPEALKKDVPVDGAIKGLNFGAGIGFMPLGSVFLNSQRINYFKISPNASLSTTLVTSSGKKIDMSLGYTFSFREYFNKNVIKRDFENELSLDFSGSINDQWSYSFGGYADFFMLSGPSEGENYLFLASTPTLNMKASDQVKLSFFYDMNYFQLTDADVSLIDSIGGEFDAGDYSGGVLSGAVFGAGGTDDFFEEIGFENSKMDIAWMESKLGIRSAWTPVKGTTLTLDYRLSLIHI